MKISILGFGNMGKTYARSFIASRFIKPSDLYLLCRDKSKVDQANEIPVENIFEQPSVFLKKSDIIILSVKPQDFQKLSEQVREFIQPDQLILSIMAGQKIETIKKELTNNKIVRAMPNLPSQIGMGMTVFTASDELDRKELFILQNLINTTGKSVYVENEILVDAATAISGSGPAYVYYFMQSMIRAAEKMGFSLSEAELLVNQTFMGAVHLHNQGDITCDEWIKRVASKGGTTEAAFKVFNNDEVSGSIYSALFAAFERAKELGR